MNSQILQKIRKLRKEKGFTQPQMAEKLNIDNSAYARLEQGKSQTCGKYFLDILKIFDLTPENFFEDIGSNFYITKDNKGTYGGNAYVENLHSENKETYQKLITNLEKENEYLKTEITFLRNLLEKK